jgi:hypothetical protein
VTIPPAWLDELRLEPGPPFQVMGTRVLDPDAWLVVDADRDAQLARKRELIRDHRDVVVALLPAVTAPSEELRGLVGGDAVGDDHPLVAAALAVQEDLVILQRVDGAWVVTGGVVCFPTHWTIAEKLGQPLMEVHRPVAHYARELGDRVDHLFDRLSAERPVWRRNWFVSPTNELHLPGGPGDVPAPERIAPDGSPMWLRSERQTLRLLPRTGAVVFTILVQLAPLGVLRARPDLAARKLRAIRSWDAAKRAYTSTGRTLDAHDRWLSEQCPSIE